MGNNEYHRAIDDFNIIVEVCNRYSDIIVVQPNYSFKLFPALKAARDHLHDIILFMESASKVRKDIES